MSLWYPGVFRDPGPAWKVGYDGTRLRLRYRNVLAYRSICGAVLHSMEGRLHAALGRLDSNDLASWTVSNPTVRGLLQHYPLEEATWHAGGWANRRFFGIEHEGRAGESLTSAQVDDTVDFLAWAAEEELWPGFIHEEGEGGTLHAHRWYMATACPSDRIPWTTIITRLEPEPSDPCALLRLNVAKWEECVGAIQRNDGPVLVRWGKFLGGGASLQPIRRAEAPP